MYPSQSKSDWLLIIKSEILQADWLKLDNDGRQPRTFNSPYNATYFTRGELFYCALLFYRQISEPDEDRCARKSVESAGIMKVYLIYIIHVTISRYLDPNG